MTAAGASRIRLTQGPDGRALVTGFPLVAGALWGGFAYHGIPSRGMVMNAEMLSPLGRGAWSQVAPPLEDLLCGRLSEEQVATSEAPLAGPLLEWLALARQARTRSLRTSSAIAFETARRLLAGDMGKEVPTAGTTGSVELRLMKEGHTSSVWLLEMERVRHSRLCINVGRDSEADDELLASTERLRLWHASDPRHVCRVHWSGRVDLALGREVDSAAATISDWIDGFELHPSHSDVGGRRLAAIAYFETEARSEVSPRQRAVGRWLRESDAAKVWDELAAFLACHADPIAGSRIAPLVNLDKGDVMWTGEHIVVVAAV